MQLEDFNNRKMIQEKIDELSRTNEALKRENQNLKTLSITDSLTGVYNRLMFEYGIKREWNRCKRHSVPLSLIMADVDFFKEFNDNYGHQAGDNCIKQIANILSDCANRSSDMVARIGGEEFVILLPHFDGESALKLAEEMRKRVEKLAIPHFYSDVSDHVTISLGVNTIIPDGESSLEEFISEADKALYKAKETRNCAVSTARERGSFEIAE